MTNEEPHIHQRPQRRVCGVSIRVGWTTTLPVLNIDPDGIPSEVVKYVLQKRNVRNPSNPGKIIDLRPFIPYIYNRNKRKVFSYENQIQSGLNPPTDGKQILP